MHVMHINTPMLCEIMFSVHLLNKLTLLHC